MMRVTQILYMFVHIGQLPLTVIWNIHQLQDLQYSSAVTTSVFQRQIVSQPGSQVLSAVCDILSFRYCSTEANSFRLM